jgi:hypothetical protein
MVCCAARGSQYQVYMRLCLTKKPKKTAVDDRRLPPVHCGSAGAEHPEGGLLDGFCLNKQAPRQKKKSRKT